MMVTAPDLSTDERRRVRATLRALASAGGITFDYKQPDKTYLAAVRALRDATNEDDHARAKSVRRVVAGYEQRRKDEAKKTAQQAKPEGPCAACGTIIKPKRREPAGIDDRTRYEAGQKLCTQLGLPRGSALQAEDDADESPEDGALYVIHWKSERGDKAWWAGYIESDGEGGYHLRGESGKSLHYSADETRALHRVVAIESPVEFDDGKEGAERKLAGLRRRLTGLSDITDETERFKIEREIYDLQRRQHAAEKADEWPEVIEEKEAAR
jgi:hypothetical protein